MELSQDEQNQVDAIKSFWQRYGNLISTVVLIIAVAVAGYRYFDHHQRVNAEKASSYYQSMILAMENDDKQTAQSQATLIIDLYPDSTYAQMAHLIQAKLAVDEEAYATAENALRTIVEQGEDNHLLHIARTRLATILALQNKTDEALTLLSGEYDGYTALYEEVKGDVYSILDQPEKARAAYQLAAQLAPGGRESPWLQMKISDLKVADNKTQGDKNVAE